MQFHGLSRVFQLVSEDFRALQGFTRGIRGIVGSSRGDPGN